MKKLLKELLQKNLSEEIISIKEITDLGIVNRVFDVEGEKGDYIIRINASSNYLEYKKEVWCLNKIFELGILTANVLAHGVMGEHCYMIQEKIPGINGKLAKQDDQANIWRTLGRYAAKFHKVNRIKEEEVENAEFHENWFSRLTYNIKELNKEDRLLKDGTLNELEHVRAIKSLKRLLLKKYETGLVHGDLCPRNVIINENEVSLIDWGTAEINIVPHNEIGVLIMSQEASELEFSLFLEGLGVAENIYKTMEEDIKLINFLHCLDKYRWAEGWDLENINSYSIKVRETFNELD